MHNVLFVFSGKAQSGKSTSASLLKEVIDKHEDQMCGVLRVERRSEVKIFSFATALKDISREYFNWDGDKNIYMRPLESPRMVMRDVIEGYASTSYLQTEEPIPDKGRQLLINIGQSFRAIRPLIWCEYVMRKIAESDKKLEDTGSTFIIDDLRFKNELITTKDFHHCYSVRLTRKDALDLKDISETDLDDSTFDFYVENNGSKEDLQAKLMEIYKKVMEKQ